MAHSVYTLNPLIGPVAPTTSMLGQDTVNNDRIDANIGEMFDASGMLFAPSIVIEDDKPYLQISYLNRFNSRAHIYGRMKYNYVNEFGMCSDSIKWETIIDSPGHGIYRVPIHLDSALRGAAVTGKVRCTVRYPDGRGPEVHHGSGTRVARMGLSVWEWLGLPLLALGVGVISKDAQCRIKIPDTDWQGHDQSEL